MTEVPIPPTPPSPPNLTDFRLHQLEKSQDELKKSVEAMAVQVALLNQVSASWTAFAKAYAAPVIVAIAVALILSLLDPL